MKRATENGGQVCPDSNLSHLLQRLMHLLINTDAFAAEITVSHVPHVLLGSAA